MKSGALTSLKIMVGINEGLYAFVIRSALSWSKVPNCEFIQDSISGERSACSAHSCRVEGEVIWQTAYFTCAN